jgi:hypothetical protein
MHSFIPDHVDPFHTFQDQSGNQDAKFSTIRSTERSAGCPTRIFDHHIGTKPI